MKWLKYGCIGCLGALGILILAVAILGGLAWQRSRTIQLEEQVLTRDLPAGRAEEPPAGVSPDSLAADMAGAPASSGTVVLSLSGADFEIERGTPGEPLQVIAKYDKSAYLLEEAFEEGEGGRWTSRVSFRRKPGGGIILQISELIRGAQPKVRILLPPARPFALELNLSQGGVKADLGGLWLTTADLDVAMGGSDIRFDEPLRFPAESVAIKGRMGGSNFSGLGNASPRRLDVEYSMGGLNLGLKGRWLNDSEIGINMSMGGGAVELPDDVNLEGLPPEAKVTKRAPLAGAPTLRFKVRKGSGELEFSD